MVTRGKMSRKAFWDAVEQRLAACSADELRAMIRAMAQETRPPDRRAFLAHLGVRETEPVTAAQVIQPEDLLADIEDLAEEFDEALQAADPWEERYGWGEYDDDDNTSPYEAFLSPLAELFDRAEAAFDYGEFDLARQAYEKLFELLDMQDDYGGGVSLPGVPGVDVDETVARYLRAVYETESSEQRPQVLYEQMQAITRRLFRVHPMMEDLIQISPHPLPDRDAFLVAWLAFLRTQNGPSGSIIDAWLREAVRLSQGTAGLEALARSEGSTRPRAYLDWFIALEGEGRYQEVLVAAQEALDVLSSQLPIRAAIADHLCDAAVKLDAQEALGQGCWEAFLAEPVLGRLLDLWDIPEDDAERIAQMQRAAEHIRGYIHRPHSSRLEVEQVALDRLEQAVSIGRSELIHALLLAGSWDAAHHLAAQGKVLGWSSRESYQGMAMAAFLVLLSEKSLDALPRNLAQFWQSSLHYSTSSWQWRGNHQEASVTDRLECAYTERFALTAVRVEQQETLLSWCLDTARQRVKAIVGNLHRKSYNKAAELTVACAEMLRLRGDSLAADGLIDEVKGRFPRHSAFQREMKAALKG